jgi:hypothetical protein
MAKGALPIPAKVCQTHACISNRQMFYLAGNKKKQAQKEAAMDADEGWTTGPIGDVEEEMDTREAGTGAGPAAAAPALGGGAALFGCVN